MHVLNFRNLLKFDINPSTIVSQLLWHIVCLSLQLLSQMYYSPATVCVHLYLSKLQ